MKTFRQFYNMNVCIVDLADSSVEVVALEEQAVSEKIGGAALNCYLYDRYGEDNPIVIGVGPLTGSFAPASCLAVATFRSPLVDQIAHVPLMLRTGPEMKFAGFDFLVLRKRALESVFLHICEGKVKFHRLEHLRGRTVPEIVKELKRVRPHGRSTIVTGPAADNGVRHAAVSTGQWGSLDKAALASTMASKNIKGLIFEGIDGLSFGAHDLEKSHEMIQRSGLHGRSKPSGFLSVVEQFGGGVDVKNLVRKSRERRMACYRCPFPCMSHIEWGNNGRGMSKQQRGVTVLDHRGFIELATKYGSDALPLMDACRTYGFDPVFVAHALPRTGSTEERVASVTRISSEADTSAAGPEGGTPGGISPSLYDRFGGGIVPVAPDELWARRVSVAMLLGICPTFLVLFQQISEHDLLSFVTDDEVRAQHLADIVSSSVQFILNYRGG